MPKAGSSKAGKKAKCDRYFFKHPEKKREKRGRRKPKLGSGRRTGLWRWQIWNLVSSLSDGQPVMNQGDVLIHDKSVQWSPPKRPDGL